MSDLLEQFLEEGRELIEEASGRLLELERAPGDEDIVNHIFRSVHTLKGNAGLFDYPALIELLHAAEELMVAVRSHEVALDAEMVDALLSAVDVVKLFLEEIETEGRLDAGSEAEGRRIAAVMSSFLQREAAPREADPASADPETLPDWVEALPAEYLDPGPEHPVTLFSYVPDDGCFFRGEDPLLIASAVPELVSRSLTLDGSRAEEADPFGCRVVLRGISRASRDAVVHALRYVEEDVELWSGPADARAEAAPPPAPVPSGTNLAGVAAMLVERQRAVLDAWSEPTAPSVAEVLGRCFRCLGDEAGMAALSQAAPELTVEALAGVVDGWAARREAEAHAASSSEVAPEELPGGSAGSREGPGAGAGGSSSRVLKVDQGKVDRLMNLIGQLVVAKNGLPYIVRKMGDRQQDPKLLVRELKEHAAVVDRITRELQSAIMEVRMLPVSQVFQRFPRLVRDVSRKLGKEIELIMVGEETQADKNVIEALSEPLVHLVRNALDHGIESAAERTAKGKPAVGRIRLSAHNENESVVIVIEDDGRGLDPQMLRDKAVRKGLVDEEEARRLSDDEARMLIFAPGFSTKEVATDLSGRGVGMDVVRSAIERVGGRLGLESEVGFGTKLTLGLPLSMAVSHVMTVTAGEQLYGIGMDSVVETVRYPANRIRTIKGREALVLREQLMPVLRLRDLLGLEPTRTTNAYVEEAVLVLRDGAESIGLVVDEFGENIEVLVRPLEGWIGQMKEYSGSAVLGDGRLLLVLDMRGLIRHGV